MVGLVAQWVFLFTLSMAFYMLGKRHGIRIAQARQGQAKSNLTRAYVVSLQQGNVFTTDAGVRLGVEGPVAYKEGDPNTLVVPVVPMDIPGTAFKLEFHKNAILELEQ